MSQLLVVSQEQNKNIKTHTMVLTRWSPEKEPPAGISTRRRKPLSLHEQQALLHAGHADRAANYVYHCGKKIKSIYLKPNLFSRAVCPVWFFAPAKKSDVTI